MKRIVLKLFNDICIAYMIVSLFMVICIIIEVNLERNNVINNSQYKSMPFIETIDEQITEYNNNINTSKENTYSKLLSSLEFFTTILPMISLFAAIVNAFVYEGTIALFDKSMTKKLNDQLKKNK